MAAPLIEAAVSQDAAGAPSLAAAPVRILLVDDQPARLLTYQTVLGPLGECLVQAASGREALRLLMEDEYALILLDVNMPGMDGFETASLIHGHPRHENTPIIFVTAVNLSDMDRLHGYKLGAVDYVMVPVIPEILRSKVEVLVELYRKRRELQLLNASLAARNQELQREKARELEALNESWGGGGAVWGGAPPPGGPPPQTPNCRRRWPSAPAWKIGCAASTIARTCSWPPSRTNCATRSPPSRTRSTSAVWSRRPTTPCRRPWNASLRCWCG